MIDTANVGESQKITIPADTEAAKEALRKKYLGYFKELAGKEIGDGTGKKHGPVDEVLDEQLKLYPEVQEDQWSQFQRAATGARKYLEATRGNHVVGAAIYAAGQARFNKDPLDVLNKALGAENVKSLNMSVTDQGGVFVDGEILHFFFGPLYEESVLFSLGLRDLPTVSGKDSYELTGFETRPSVTWGNEPFVQNAYSEPTTGARELTLKIAGIKTAVTLDLLRSPAGTQVMSQLEDMLRRELRLGVDEQGIIGSSNTQYRFKGLFGHTGSTTPQTGTLLTQVLADHATILTAIDDALIPMSRMAIIMPGRSVYNLQWATFESTDRPYFGEEMRGGTIFGFPFRKTHFIPKTLGGGTESYHIYLDRDEVWLVLGPEMEVRWTEDSYVDAGGTLRSAGDRRERVLRAFIKAGMAVPHNDAIHRLTGVTIGAP